jgi:uncharacterized membrane protein YkvA (DUF1232 family)
MRVYLGLREDLDAAGIAQLAAEVRAHLDGLVRAQRRNELLAIDLAEVLCQRLQGLLAAAGELDAEARGHIVGAARYFVSANDAIPDDRACTGLDDDVEVFNHVVGLLGRSELAINS